MITYLYTKTTCSITCPTDCPGHTTPGTVQVYVAQTAQTSLPALDLVEEISIPRGFRGYRSQQPPHPKPWWKLPTHLRNDRGGKKPHLSAKVWKRRRREFRTPPER